MSKLSYISIKTQVRRLKYFSVFLELLNDKGSRKDFIEKELLSWSELKHHAFEKLPSQTGEIVRPKTPKSSRSFSNYYDAIKKLQLVDENFEFIIPSRIGSVFKALCKDLNLSFLIKDYQLSNLEKIYLLFLIYRSDADYYFTILKMIYEKPEELQDYYIKQFQSYYINRLESKIHSIDSTDKLLLLDSLNRVKEWRKPERYCEDIVPPRLNWMIDLSLIDIELYQKTRKIKLNDIGLCLLYSLPQNDFNLLDISEAWLGSCYLKTSLVLFEHNTQSKIRYWNSLNEEEKILIAIDLFELVYKHFNVLGLPRVSMEQTLMFCSIYALFSKNILVEFNELYEWIGFEKKLGNWKIGIRNSARMYESYILIDHSQ